MPAGFRVLKRKRKVDPAWVEKFRRIPVANVSDSMFRMSAGGARLRPYHKGGTMAGPAVTVRTAPGDNLMVHMALNLAEKGDVIVVGGELTNAIIGERMLAYCQAKGFAGIVINGAVRDVGYIRAHDFPVYAAGVTHRGPYKNGPGEINATVALDGMAIAPGDLVLGDDDGLLCVPCDDVEAVYKLAHEKHEMETRTFKDIGKGDNNRAQYEKTLRELGCEFES
jgi:regulator of RNase E activity RraA